MIRIIVDHLGKEGMAPHADLLHLTLTPSGYAHTITI